MEVDTSDAEAMGNEPHEKDANMIFGKKRHGSDVGHSMRSMHSTGRMSRHFDHSRRQVVPASTLESKSHKNYEIDSVTKSITNPSVKIMETKKVRTQISAGHTPVALPTNTH